VILDGSEEIIDLMTIMSEFDLVFDLGSNYFWIIRKNLKMIKSYSSIFLGNFKKESKDNY